MRPFLPPEVAQKSAAAIEKWSEDYLMRLLDLAAALGDQDHADVLGRGLWMGTGHGLSVGLLEGRRLRSAGAKGRERFVKKTAALRARANKLGIYLAHEIHPGTAAMCADDFNTLAQICDGDKCLTVNADPSHCWEGEDWETRFLKVAPRIYACHVKNIVIRRGLPLRMMEPAWPKRAMQFVDISSGELNMTRYVELLVQAGYPQRYRAVMRTKTAPLVVEAESAYRDLDAASADGVAYVRDRLCFPLAQGSFEEGMGTAKG